MDWTNPQSTIAQQLGRNDEKLLALALWVAVKKGVLRITAEDVDACLNEFASSGGPVVFTHGVNDAIELSLITWERVKEIENYERARQQGRA